MGSETNPDEIVGEVSSETHKEVVQQAALSAWVMAIETLLRRPPVECEYVYTGDIDVVMLDESGWEHDLSYVDPERDEGIEAVATICSQHSVRDSLEDRLDLIEHVQAWVPRRYHRIP